MEIIKSVGKEKSVKWEIVKILSKANPGYDFGVNPKAISDELLLIGIELKPIDVGHMLVKMGFKEKRTSGKLYRTIFVDKLKKLEYQLVGQDEKQIEKTKPLLIQLYHNGYNDGNGGSHNIDSHKFHDKIPEPIRHEIGKWYCRTPIKEIEKYLEKCKAEGLI